MLLLTIASGPNRGRAVRLAEESRHVIGRRNGTIELDDPKASRNHAEITALPDGRVLIRDLGSSNGTFVDKKKIDAPAELRDGAILQIGRSLLVFTRVSDVVANLPTTPPRPAEPKPDPNELQLKVIEEIRDSIRTLQSTPPPAPPTPVIVRDEVAAKELAPKIDALHEKINALARDSRPPQPDPALHARLDDVAEALNRMADEGSTPPPWADQLTRKIDSAAASTPSRAELSALAEKVQTLIGIVQSLPKHADAGAAVESKLDAVRAAVLSDALAQTPADLAAITSRLDDLLALVAAQYIPGTTQLQPLATPELESKLDAILDAVRTQLPAAAQAELTAQLDAQWRAMEERLMQHLRGTGERSQEQVRTAVAELTAVVRAMADGSDRVVLEQILSEVRAQDTGALARRLDEMQERMRRLPVSGSSAHQTVLADAGSFAVRDALAKIDAQLKSIPDKVNNNLVLGDILDLLRAIERHQRHQSQWLQGMDEKLDMLGAGETAVFAPVEGVATDPSDDSSVLSTGF